MDAHKHMFSVLNCRLTSKDKKQHIYQFHLGPHRHRCAVQSCHTNTSYHWRYSWEGASIDMSIDQLYNLSIQDRMKCIDLIPQRKIMNQDKYISWTHRCKCEGQNRHRSKDLSYIQIRLGKNLRTDFDVWCRPHYLGISIHTSPHLK